MNYTQILAGLKVNDERSLARAITVVENETEGCRDLLLQLPLGHPTKIIGITGSPGAGKSSLIDLMIGRLAVNHRVAVIAVDPTSPFTNGSFLGDRLRMDRHFNNKNVFIRSVATRGALGGLSRKAFEMADVLRSARFDFILIETVGVGQSETEVAALADLTVVVLVPESGDEVQMLKSGIVEIADVFVVNKSDHPGADNLVMSIQAALSHRPAGRNQPPVIKTSVVNKTGIDDLIEHIENYHLIEQPGKKSKLLAERAWHIISDFRMRNIDVEQLENLLTPEMQKPDFNIYRFVQEHYLK